MITHTNVEIILYAITVYQLLFFTIQLISFKKSNPARKYLGILLMGMTIFTVLNALFFTGSYALIVWLYIIYVPVLLTLLPLFYLYIRSLTKNNVGGGLDSKLILFIPPIVLLLLNIFTFGISPVQEKLLFLATDHTIYNNSFPDIDGFLLIFWFAMGVMVPVQLALAAAKTIKLIKIKKHAAESEPAHLAYLQFRWVNIISFSLLVFLMAAVVQILFISNQSIVSTIVFNVIVLVSSGLFGYFAMKQDALFTQVAQMGSLKQVIAEKHIEPGTKPGPGMPGEEIAEIIEKIRRLMEEGKPYLVKNYGINDLSMQTAVKRQKLTSVINDAMNTNYNGLINDYRIREAIRLMEDDTHNHTIDAIADKAGFHTRSSFYACFKKYTGQTPKEFMMENGREGEMERWGDREMERQRDGVME